MAAVAWVWLGYDGGGGMNWPVRVCLEYDGGGGVNLTYLCMTWVGWRGSMNLTSLSMTWVRWRERYGSDLFVFDLSIRGGRYEYGLSKYDSRMRARVVWIWPIWVWLEYEGGGGDVEHDLPAHKGLPGEPDHGSVRAVSQQVAVELPVTLHNAYTLKNWKVMTDNGLKYRRKNIAVRRRGKIIDGIIRLNARKIRVIKLYIDLLKPAQITKKPSSPTRMCTYAD